MKELKMKEMKKMLEKILMTEYENLVWFVWLNFSIDTKLYWTFSNEHNSYFSFNWIYLYIIKWIWICIFVQIVDLVVLHHTRFAFSSMLHNCMSTQPYSDIDIRTISMLCVFYLIIFLGLEVKIKDAWYFCLELNHRTTFE